MKFLSDDFLSAWADAERPALGSASGSMTVKTEGGPDGKVAFTIELLDGRVTEARPGATKGADVELTIPYDLAADLFRGDEDPAVAFMRGSLKMSGDMAVWLEVLPAWRDQAVSGEVSPVVADTEF
ncbi:MAG: SCP2 sterol-binding domain-containing protein [Actinomycetota bacterium]|jgi:putative sterol carrier protein|nr:SCP2 sterol-binding domain-containing protein [Actinomycetota bacterium]